MDAFRQLTTGVRFKKQKVATQVIPLDSPSLPPSLDFFSTSAEPSTSTLPSEPLPPATKSKKRKRSQAVAVPVQSDADYLRLNRTKLTGLAPLPSPLLSLSSFPLPLQQNWTNVLKLATPTSVQATTWGILSSDRDALVCAPTGSGKTLAFLAPCLALNQPTDGKRAKGRPTAVILEPTRELARQVWRVADKFGGGGWKSVVLGEEEEDKEDEEKDAPEGETVVKDQCVVDVLITTPLRLIYAVKSNLINLSDVHHLILDEADTLFSLNFLPQTDSIIAACTNPLLRKALFSATISSTVEEMAKGIMHEGMVRVIVGHKESATTTIAQSLLFCNTEDHKLSTLRSLIASGSFTPPVLIFVQSILRAKELSTALTLDGINCDCIHAEKTSLERDEVVQHFAEGKIWALVSTDVMSRGVDFKGVKMVVNYDFPQSGDSYIHRIGRTGRAGKAGKAITFFTKPDAVHLKSIVNIMVSSGCPIPSWMLDLRAPSQDEKKKLLMKPIGRKDVSRTIGAGVGDEGDRKGLKGKRNRVMGGERKKKEGKQGEEKVKRKVKGEKKVVGERESKKAKREVAMDE